MNEGEQYPVYVINFDRIIESKLFPAVVRETARSIKDNSYLVLADWLRDLHDTDMQILLAYGEEVVFNNRKPEALIVLAIMICSGEGIDPPTSDLEFHNVLNRLNMLIAAEAMSRRGFAEFQRDKATLSEEIDETKFIKLNLNGLLPNDPPEEE